MKKTAVLITIYRYESTTDAYYRVMVDSKWLGPPAPPGSSVLCQFEIQVSDLLKLIPQLW